MSYRTFIGAIALAATALSPIAAAARPTPPAEVRTEAADILNAAYPADGPGAAAIVTRHGKIVYAGGRGLANIAGHTPITPDTVFELGSIAKQFTAAVILQLVAEKRLSLDDPLSKSFPDWPQPGATATVRQLLNHTSGIPDFSKIPGWISKNGERDVTTEELLTLTKSLPAKVRPGTKWEYNNGGYVILGAIVEKLTGKPWHQAVDERIAKPLGLTSMRYAVTAERSGALARRYSEKDGKFVLSSTANMSIAGAAGGLVASVRDMAKWAEALHGGKVVGPALYREMTAPARLADGKTEPYGFALHLRKIMGHEGYEHGGAGRGIDTDSIYLPADGVFVAVFSNSDDLPTDSSDVLRRMSALAIGSPVPSFHEAKVDPKAVEPAFGVYKGNEDPLRFFARGGKFYIARGDDEMQLLPAAADTFYSANDALSWIKLVRNSGGRQLELYGTRDATPQRFVRTGAIPAEVEVKVPPAVIASYAGDYQTETLAVSISSDKDGWLLMAPKGQEPVRWRPIAQDEFKSEDNRMRIKFFAVNGKVDTFTMYRGARELHGKRVK